MAKSIDTTEVSVNWENQQEYLSRNGNYLNRESSQVDSLIAGMDDARNSIFGDWSVLLHLEMYTSYLTAWFTVYTY